MKHSSPPAPDREPTARPRAWLVLVLPLILAGGLAAGSMIGLNLHPPGAAPSPEAPAPEFAALPLDRLDAFVQKRFQTVDMVHFGIERMEVERPGHRTFYPSTREEKAVTRQIRESGWIAQTLTVGRGLLTPQQEGFTPTKAQPQRYDPYVKHEVSYAVDLVKSPVLSDLRWVNNAPVAQRDQVYKEYGAAFKQTRLRDALLRGAGRTMLTQHPTPARQDYEDGLWHIVVRPVAASQASCVNCHNPGGITNLKLGDTVGVVVYAFARADEFERQWRHHAPLTPATKAL